MPASDRKHYRATAHLASFLGIIKEHILCLLLSRIKGSFHEKYMWGVTQLRRLRWWARVLILTVFSEILPDKCF